MDELIHNTTFEVDSGFYKGLWRVLVNDKSVDHLVIAKIPQEKGPPETAHGRKKAELKIARFKGKRKAEQRTPLFDAPRCELEALKGKNLLRRVTVQVPHKLRVPEPDPAKLREVALFEQRKITARVFLERSELERHLTHSRGLGRLIEISCRESGCARSSAYRMFALLCCWGFDQRSLNLRMDKCGGKGKRRPASGGRAKAGRKTRNERLGIEEQSPQPGCSEEWLRRIYALDDRIPRPKPPMKKRCVIIQNGFVSEYQEGADGKLIGQLVLGDYPNERQIQHALSMRDEVTKIEERTTKGHFTRNVRGHNERNWRGVSGPGHTFVIDSTIGDIYLRSRLNRSWVIGRPIVYVISDLWSTAAVGVHVCLTGPSWATAQVALFSTLVDSAELGRLWGLDFNLGLFPQPTLPGYLLCDRGEYLCKASRDSASQHGFKLSYAAPRRPDWKGNVEVLHRITKNMSQIFVYGAFDARRKELELKPNYKKSALTLQEFMASLMRNLSLYNLHADRTYRTDAYMKANGIPATPAGLWAAGYESGIGYMAKHIEHTDLITSFLPTVKGTIGRDGIYLGDLLYKSAPAKQEQWTTIARARGVQAPDVSYFPGSLGRVWTPHTSGSGLLEWGLSDQALCAPNVSLDEYLDSAVFEKLGTRLRKHNELNAKLKAAQEQSRTNKEAKAAVAQAEANRTGPIPTITEARQAESGILETATSEPGENRSVEPDDASMSPLETEYSKYMQEVLDSVCA